MRVQELQHALAVQPGTSELDSDALIDGDILISVCLGIVVVEHDSGNVGLIHFTAQEYFLQHPMHESLRAQETIAQSCLTYLAFDGFAKGCCHNAAMLTARSERYPFIWYAVRWWGVHLQKTSDKEVLAQALEFLVDDRKVEAAEQLMNLLDYGRAALHSRGFTGLHIAARFGLWMLAQSILERTVSFFDRIFVDTLCVRAMILSHYPAINDGLAHEAQIFWLWNPNGFSYSIRL